jgi:hypothetical protein
MIGNAEGAENAELLFSAKHTAKPHDPTRKAVKPG